MKAPLVSVIMPVHNAAAYVSAAVQSVLDQSERDLELLVVDDASTDQSGEVLARIDDLRVRRFRNETPLNAAGARNRALAEARGEFVVFLDADDIAEPQRLDRQLRALRRRPELGVVASRTMLIDKDAHPYGTSFPVVAAEEIPALLLFRNCLALSSIMARRVVLRPFEPNAAPAEDYALWCALARETGFSILKQTLTRYRVHQESVSVRQAEKMRAAVAAIHTAQLARLGLAKTPPIHGLLSSWPLHPTLEQLREAEAWLLTLREANDRHGIYSSDIFQRVVSRLWFNQCLDSWLLGWEVWPIFHRSLLATPTLFQRARLLQRLAPRRLRLA